MTTFPPIPPAIYRRDPDETDGRRLYRAHAEALARAQLAYEKRRVRLAGEPKP